MKKVILLIFLTVITCRIEAQCELNLDDYRQEKWHEADSLVLNASSVYDTIEAIYEYQVSKSAPAYMRLGRLYKQLGYTKGMAAFSYAEEYFLKCKRACSDSAASASAEIMELNAAMREYSKGPYKYVGLWGYYRNNYDFVPCVHITYDGKKYIFHLYPILYEYSGIDEVIYSQVHADTSKREITYTFEYKVSSGGCYMELSEYADKGYAKTGPAQYMTERLVTETNAIYFSGDAVCIKFLKFHEERFVDGIKTYSATGKKTKKSMVLYPANKEDLYTVFLLKRYLQ